MYSKVKAKLSLWAYSCLACLAQPLLRRKLRKRAQSEPRYGEDIAQRFGFYKKIINPEKIDSPLIWIHAVSLGETRAAAILLKELRSLLPNMRLLLTNGTATGYLEGKKLLSEGDLQVWQPWDTQIVVRRFLRKFQPDIGILIETEVWPNLVHVCKKLGMPLVLANARLNEKSQNGAKHWPSLLLPAYSGLHTVWAQTAVDAERLISLGAPVAEIFGNLKFDVEPEQHLLQKGRIWREHSRKPVVIIASSREGEEAQWLAQWMGRKFHGVAGQCQWLIVPRHPQRFDEVYALLSEAGLRVSRRSDWGDGLPPLDTDVWLGDSVGEMQLYYAASHIGLLGGSFEPLGGQNLIEAAACACPMVLGPHTFNFAEASRQATEQGAAFRVLDMEQGVQLATALARDNLTLGSAQQQALHFAKSHRGAAKKTAKAIFEIISH